VKTSHPTTTKIPWVRNYLDSINKRTLKHLHINNNQFLSHMGTTQDTNARIWWQTGQQDGRTKGIERKGVRREEDKGMDNEE
jgi:hypothetical protein